MAEYRAWDKNSRWNNKHIFIWANGIALSISTDIAFRMFYSGEISTNTLKNTNTPTSALTTTYSTNIIN
ncbi:MAG: hypothetical protein N3E50_06965 [Candidatus Goldbacteria bacterium]|nr:hypothetical protein [Candidatus Goldiibacteriota bacterium]